jgi:hypothetical protein
MRSIDQCIVEVHHHQWPDMTHNVKEALRVGRVNRVVGAGRDVDKSRIVLVDDHCPQRRIVNGHRMVPPPSIWAAFGGGNLLLVYRTQKEGPGEGP